MNLKEIEKEIQGIPELRLRGVLKKRKETLEQFIVKFFTKFNKEKDTIYTGNNHIQTTPGKRRSIGDVYKICKYYYPKCTLEQVKDFLYGDAFKEIPAFRSSICGMIDKRVFYVGNEKQKTALMEVDGEDEFELTVDQWKKL